MERTKYTFFGNIQMWFKACTQNTDLYESNCSISKAGSPNQDVPLWFSGGMGNWESWQVLWETRIWNSVVVVRRDPGIWLWWEGDLGCGGEKGTWDLVLVRRRPRTWCWWDRDLGSGGGGEPGTRDLLWWEGDLGSHGDEKGTWDLVLMGQRPAEQCTVWVEWTNMRAWDDFDGEQPCGGGWRL